MPPHYRTGTESVEIAARRRFFDAAPVAFGCSVSALPGIPATLLSVLAMPSPTMNRVIGLPGGQPLTPERHAQIRRFFRERGIPRFWIHAWDTPADAVLRASLQALGCRPAGAWAKFEGDLSASAHLAASPRIATPTTPTATPPPPPMPMPRPPPTPTPTPTQQVAAPLALRRATADEYGLAGQILCDSFGMPPVLVPWMAGLAGRPEWQVYFACGADGVPIATGTLLIDGDQAWLGMGATLPAAQRQGSQQALLAIRLAAAKEAGCITVSVEAEAAAPGESRPSLNNIRRAGLREVGIRWNYLCES